MKVTVFVNWSDNIILTEKDLEKEIEVGTLERFDESEFFDEWLSRNFGPSEIFDLTESEKETHRNRYKEYCRQEAKMALLEEYETVELEI